MSGGMPSDQAMRAGERVRRLGMHHAPAGRLRAPHVPDRSIQGLSTSEVLARRAAGQAKPMHL